MATATLTNDGESDNSSDDKDQNFATKTTYLSQGQEGAPVENPDSSKDFQALLGVVGSLSKGVVDPHSQPKEESEGRRGIISGDGVTSIQISEKIFDEAKLFWKSFVVVNRIWSSPKAGIKNDVQFIEKNTVLLHIENSQMRAPVLHRNISRRWGHKGQDCVSKEIKIMHKSIEVEKTVIFVLVPQEVGKTGIVEGNAIEDLIQDLEALTPQAMMQGPMSSSGDMTISLGDHKLIISSTKEVQAYKGFSNQCLWKLGNDSWQEVESRYMIESVEREGVMVSPSRYSPLLGIEEDDEEVSEEVEKEIEEGEIQESKAEGKKIQRPQTPHRGKRSANGYAQKGSRGAALRSKGLMLAGRQGPTKKASCRKICVALTCNASTEVYEHGYKKKSLILDDLVLMGYKCGDYEVAHESSGYYMCYTNSKHRRAIYLFCAVGATNETRKPFRSITWLIIRIFSRLTKKSENPRKQFTTLAQLYLVSTRSYNNSNIPFAL
ncbi:LOW QUALITY PROTEIN: hypothetical protein HID58_022232 [Brassica napus]|uniref:Uncharacterized protein n=1 Tax=Brassica napus TaxID=3708 RepID=A0ABQ8CYP6_BRANA|nr:LOW QUALITY PROTEIN: hypothetical protein HID58_022232 [Brassica napus]